MANIFLSSSTKITTPKGDLFSDENEEQVYRFSCNENWETRGDQIYESIEEAIEQLPDQYREVPAKWIKFEE